MVRRILLAALLAGCAQSGLEAEDPPPALDAAWFRCDVQPVLAARCAFFACHGTATRPLRVYAPNRLRLDVPPDRRDEALTDAELAANYDMARGFAESRLLLLKPLDQTAGGWFHRGATLYGRGDVFLSTDDPGYRALEDWVGGATAPADCTPITEVGP